MAKLHFYYSAMNAGKSTTLLQSSHNYQERGMDTLIYAPELDDRFGQGKVTSRLGIQADALLITSALNIFEDVTRRIESNPNIQCVLVDEAQFLTKDHVLQLGQVVDHCHLPVLAYGIRTDFQGEAFPGSQYLLAWADELIELKTICHCGSKATMILRLNAKGQVIREGEQVAVGGNESYVSTCRKHFYAGEAISVNETFLSAQTLVK
ncbi:MAG: thymidine kinase [Legionellales bacterium]|nr:thymidine kinase [Legionellales bacterium]HAG61415.1 thymidine kinase [Coxiellaceae bacterium]